MTKVIRRNTAMIEWAERHGLDADRVLAEPFDVSPAPTRTEPDRVLVRYTVVTGDRGGVHGRTSGELLTSEHPPASPFTTPPTMTQPATRDARPTHHSNRQDDTMTHPATPEPTHDPRPARYIEAMADGFGYRCGGAVPETAVEAVMAVADAEIRAARAAILRDIAAEHDEVDDIYLRDRADEIEAGR